MAKIHASNASTALPTRIVLDMDLVYVQPHGNSEYTRQFYAGQVIVDSQAIAEIIALGILLREQS